MSIYIYTAAEIKERAGANPECEFVLASDFKARIDVMDRALFIENLKFEGAIKHLTAITSMLAPENIQLPDGRVLEFSPPAHSALAYWRGLSTAIRAARDHVEAAQQPAADGDKS